MASASQGSDSSVYQCSSVVEGNERINEMLRFFLLYIFVKLLVKCCCGAFYLK